MIRNPASIRPWQFVLEPLHGYLLLAEKLLSEDGFADAWNFGPFEHDVRPVRWIADALVERWSDGAEWRQDGDAHPHEATTLKLDSTRARTLLHWTPRLSLGESLDWIVAWHRAADARAVTLQQIERYETLLA